jgi:hypothetical protein
MEALEREKAPLARRLQMAENLNEQPRSKLRGI